MDELKNHLLHFSRRMRLRDGWELAQHTLWVAALLALLIQLAGRFLPIERLWLWALAPFLGWLLVIASIAAFRPWPLLHIARHVDVELNLFERLSTCLVLQETRQAFPPELVWAQQQDALHAARNINVSQAFPLLWQRRPLMIAGLLAAIMVVSVFLPNPMDAILAQRRAVAEAAKQQAERVEKMREEIEAAEGLSPEEREELLRQLSELAKQLRANPGDLEQALADLSRMEEALRQKMDPNAAAKAANLKSLAAQLEALAGQKTDPNRDAMEAAAEALSKLAEQAGALDEAQRKEQAQQLAQLAAQAAQAGNADLAQALAEMAQAMQSGNQNAATQQAQQAAQSMQQTQQQLNAQAAMQQALNQLQASQQAMAQASQQAAAQPGQNSAPGQNAAGQNPGASAGQNPSNSPGQSSGGGGGTNASTLPPRTGQGQAGRPQGSQPGEAGTDLSNQVYVPREIAPGSDNEVFIPGQDTGQGETQTTEGQGQLPGSTNPALVPYYDVFYNYLTAANQTMQQSYIPASLLDYVREYFSQLEP